jgi:uroporphyrinogen-III decarboxylase
MRLYYLRGFENLMLDIATHDERLDELIEIIIDYNARLVQKYLDLEPDFIYFGDDLGMQERLTIRPDDWRRYIKPGYARLFQMCREAGVHAYLHSDGYIVDIMPDLVEIGTSVVNPQDLCNGIDAIRERLKGRACIALDIDRQSIVPFGTPAQIDAHVEHCIAELGSPRGGLTLVAGLYPGVPPDNVEALLSAMSRHRKMYV